MAKLNSKIIPLTLERYQALVNTSPKLDKAVQCEKAQEIVPINSDVLRDTPYKRRGQRLIWHMLDNEMHWDQMERLILGTDTVVKTNVAKLIKDVCSDEDSSIDSRHSRDFFKILILTKFDFKYGKIDQ